MKTKSSNSIRGVTLVEIAIVLVIIGLLLGGILKGQELINNAKVRSIADRQNSLKVAWFAFIDRFQALPGDYISAQQYIPGATNGGGNGLIDEKESPLVFQHLSGAGYLRCPQCNASSTSETPTAANSLQNQYGGVMAIFHDSEFYAANGGQNARLLIHTGARIPSNIVSEVDRKLDDGIANSGDFRFNIYDPISGTRPVLECQTSDQSKQAVPTGIAVAGVTWYRHASAAPPVVQNCGGSISI